MQTHAESTQMKQNMSHVLGTPKCDQVRADHSIDSKNLDASDTHVRDSNDEELPVC